MFYQGDIQSGIAAAMREAKPVVCFVRDDEDESVIWENEYFNDDELRVLVSNNSIALHLMAGTQEAGFLTSICPVDSFPAVMVIRNGVLQEYLISGTPKDAFQRRLKAVFAEPSNTLNPSFTSTPVSPPYTPDNDLQTPLQTVETPGTTGYDLDQMQAPVPSTNSQPQMQNNDDSIRGDPIQSPPVTQIPTRQASNETTEPTNREGVRNGKQPENQETPEEKRASYETEERRAMLLKIQREQKAQKEERERIRNQIKHDQEARRKRAAEDKGILESAAAAYRSTTTGTTGGNKSRKKQASEYRLQIRLFDGSSVRNGFPPSATIQNDVRPWLDSQRSDGSQPYNLKHILTPLPNRTISVSEEERSLEELELGPTASLVMVPVPSYTEAYTAPSVADSLPGRVVSSGYGLVSGVVGSVAGMVGGLLGYGNSSDQANVPIATPETISERDIMAATVSARARNGQRINIRTLHDQWGDQDKNEFYNGNTLNFEPRKDDDPKDK